MSNTRVQHRGQPFPWRAISRRGFLQLAAITTVAGVSVACRAQPASAPLPSVALETFPMALGRGFPVGNLVGAVNDETGINPGDIAPNFRMQLEDDQGLYLADLVGRPVMINFWATWCGPCRLEMPEIVHYADTEADLVVIAINVEEQLEPIAAFAEDFQMNMPVVRDERGEIRNLYQVRGMPTTAFIDRAGKIATYREGVMSPSMLEELLTPIL